MATRAAAFTIMISAPTEGKNDMAYVRFSVPEFDYKKFKKMSWRESPWLGPAEIERLTAGQRKGDPSAWGAYAIKPADAFFDKLAVKGDRRHAVMCVLPDRPVALTARSRAWHIQRVVAVDSPDGNAMNVVVDWKTPRPISTTLGPPQGTAIKGGVIYLVCCRQYADYWIGNRTILDNDWKKGRGFRILSARDEGADDFHEICLTFEWEA